MVQRRLLRQSYFDAHLSTLPGTGGAGIYQCADYSEGKEGWIASPDTKKYDVTINNGNNDFGGEPHALGSPVTSGSAQLTRDTNGVVPNGKVVGRVKGTLYWDALFDKGCRRLIIDYQDLNGANLNEKTIDRCGSGGNANDAANKLSVNESFTSGAIMRIHLRLGTLQQNGSFNNIVTRTYGWN